MKKTMMDEVEFDIEENPVVRNAGRTRNVPGLRLEFGHDEVVINDKDVVITHETAYPGGAIVPTNCTLVFTSIDVVKRKRNELNWKQEEEFPEGTRFWFSPPTEWENGLKWLGKLTAHLPRGIAYCLENGKCEVVSD